MNDIDRALADIADIRSQIATGTMFQGFGPAVIATTGVLALTMATAQTVWPEQLVADPLIYLAGWIGVAIVSAFLIGAEMLARSRRFHAGLADAMIVNAIEQFLPAIFAGAAIGYALFSFAPQAAWTLPGIWQVLVALGIFASARSLPRSVALVGAWYFLAGVCVLIVASSTQSLSPWIMGIPFGVGQLLMAAVLRAAGGAHHAQH